MRHVSFGTAHLFLFLAACLPECSKRATRRAADCSDASATFVRAIVAKGEMAAADTTVSFILNKIRNPGFSGRSGDFQIVVIDPDVSELQEAEALAARQATLDSGNKVCVCVGATQSVAPAAQAANSNRVKKN